MPSRRPNPDIPKCSCRGCSSTSNRNNKRHCHTRLFWRTAVQYGIYVKALDYPEASIKDLRGFKKIELAAGQTGKVTITLDGEAFQYYNPSIDELSPRAGRYQILYGTSSRDKDLKSLDFVVK